MSRPLRRVWRVSYSKESKAAHLQVSFALNIVQKLLAMKCAAKCSPALSTIRRSRQDT